MPAQIQISPGVPAALALDNSAFGDVAAAAADDDDDDDVDSGKPRMVA